MSDYTITTNFGAKDSLPSGNAGKVIKGSEFTTEFTNIQTAIATKADTAGDTFTGVVNFSADVAVNTNTLFVDVSEAKVGIGTTSPANTLTVGNLTASTNDQDATVGIKCNANHRGIILQENDGAEQWEIGVGEAGALKFYDSGSATPAVTFADGTGDVLVGKTSADNTTQGIRLLGSEGFSSFVRDGAEPIVVNRLSSDGNLVEFRKDSTNAGTIGNSGTRLFAGSGATGLMYDGSNNYIVPWNTSTNAGRDGAIDLGVSAFRFKDLHLSGSGYFGGNVGIGTSSPAKLLHVSGGDVRIESTFPRLYLTDSNNNSDYSIINNNGQFGIYDDTNATYRMVIANTSGNVGIGTTSPNESLVVKGGTYAANQSGGMALQMGDTSGSHWQSSFKIKSDGSGNVRTAIDASTGATGGQSQEVISINTAGKVGIGTTSPSDKLHVSTGTDTDSGNIAFTIGGTSTSNARTASITKNTSTPYELTIQAGNHATSNMETVFKSSDSKETMRIDSSGNLLVGKTATGFGTAGIELFHDNQVYATSTTHGLAVNRLSTDGALAKFYKDGSTIGSIGAVGGDMYLSTGARGIHISDGANSIVPCNATGGDSDATTSLGLAGARFQDLYLSGGVHLGGTGSANKLDDYEEGTWTPNLYGHTTGSSSPLSYGSAATQYTKVGSLVYFNAYITNVVASGHSLTGDFRISGLPFTANKHAPMTFTYTDLFTFDDADISVSGYVSSGSTYISVRKGSSKGAVSVTEFTNNNTSDLMISGSYTTNS